MNVSNVHLILNHVTVVGIPIASIFLLHGIFKGNLFSRRFALAIVVLLSATVIPVFLTGEPSEEIVEGFPGVLESFIESHEDAGKVSMILTVILGVAAAIALWFQKEKRKGKNAALLVFILSLIPMGSLVYTGSLGGKIRHTEIRNDSGSSTQDAATDPGKDNEEHEDSEDD